ncbi:NAD-dependent epimerase/dehydratase family protein [Archangium violaceum]|uniref:NAD-dependent epimerase/dehydratase family protein n=1 Tax=Archangium violaceum TaxID=83451 RepID=UPI00194DEEEA|nr:NAD-dependent epimerase/dehydratase family protein [Archangium violaceum]QRN97233.1 NAD-dependent epimerase/dehydratase family protein [Archangium violaceum]
MGKIALFGAGGAIGGSVASALRAQGRAYRVVGRSRGPLEAQFGADPLAEIVTWNPEDPASVRAAAEGVETLVYLIGVPYWEFQKHPVLMRQTLEGAMAAGVSKLVQIGTVYPFGRPRTERVDENHPREPHTFKGRMRKAQEDLVLGAHGQRGLQTTILRLPDFYGPHVERSFLHSAFEAALAGRRADLIGPIDTPHEYVFVPDVGPVVTALADEPRAYGRAWNLAGAGVTTQRELVERIFAHMGRPPKYRVAGPWMVRAIGLFNRFMRELAEMEYLQTTPVLMDDSALRGLLGEVRKTSYEEGIRRTFEALAREMKSTRPETGALMKPA